MAKLLKASPLLKFLILKTINKIFGSRKLFRAKKNLCFNCFIAAALRSSPQNIIHAPLPKTAHQFIVVAHRGDHTQAPENTLTAFENAIREGVDYVEIDLRTTKDSQLITPQH